MLHSLWLKALSDSGKKPSSQEKVKTDYQKAITKITTAEISLCTVYVTLCCGDAIWYYYCYNQSSLSPVPGQVGCVSLHYPICQLNGLVRGCHGE